MSDQPFSITLYCPTPILFCLSYLFLKNKVPRDITPQLGKIMDWLCFLWLNNGSISSLYAGLIFVTLWPSNPPNSLSTCESSSLSNNLADASLFGYFHSFLSCVSIILSKFHSSSNSMSLLLSSPSSILNLIRKDFVHIV